MKTFLMIIGLILFASLFIGCEDPNTSGNNTGDDIVVTHNCYGANAADDPSCWASPDTTDPPEEDNWKEDTYQTDKSLDELCGGYPGLWDCTVTEGMGEGNSFLILIELSETLEYQHIFWLEYIHPGEGQGTFVCNGIFPSETGTGGYLSPPNNGILTYKVIHPIVPERSRTLECTPHISD